MIVGVGEASERIDDAGYRALSEADLAADAVRAALADTGADVVALTAALDTAAMTRSFDGMGLGSPLGSPTNYPWAVLRRVGAEPAYVRYEHLGGQTPQSLVNELCQRIADGESEAAVVFGADVTSTTRHLTGMRERGEAVPDYSEEVDAGPTHDRGRGMHLVNNRHGVLHGQTNAPAQYALLENARRARLRMTRGEYALDMARLMAPMSRVAAGNPHSASPVERSVEEVATPTSSNRAVSDPYLRLMIARDQVNQGAACVIVSAGTAQRLGIPPERWVFLPGHAALAEKPLLARTDLSRSPAAVAAVEHALHLAGLRFDDLTDLDLYSCFPIAVSMVTDAFGVAHESPRDLTVTGGLPYFGGAGSNYTLHAVAEVVRRVRADHDRTALVGANGGVMSKYAVGVYAARPTPWQPDDSAALQRAIDDTPSVRWTEVADGPATIETWTVRDRTGYVIARDLGGHRFLAQVAPDDVALLDRLTGADGTDDPVGTGVYARHDRAVAVGTNVVASSRAELDRAVPQRPVSLTDSFPGIGIRRDGVVLEVEFQRPEHRNALTRATHAHLEAVFDAFVDDPHLRVAIVHGQGADFCTGVDLDEVGWASTLTTPPSGFAGLTGRRLAKPVIAAVAGAAHDAGLELLLAVPLVLADATATFALTQPAHGLVAEHGGLDELPRFVGERLAAEMVLTGRALGAGEALAAGLVTRTAPAGAHLEHARRLAAEVAALSPTALRASLRHWAGATDAVDEVTFSEDLIRGLDARRSGGAPAWAGH